MPKVVIQVGGVTLTYAPPSINAIAMSASMRVTHMTYKVFTIERIDGTKQSFTQEEFERLLTTIASK